MPEKKYDMNDLSPKINVVDYKRDFQIMTKAIRHYSKDFGKNQFETALILLRQFMTIIGLHMRFLQDKEMRPEFLAYIRNISDSLLHLLSNYIKFQGEIDEKTIPIFGGNKP